MQGNIKVGYAAVSFQKSFWGFEEKEYKNHLKELVALGKKAGFTVTSCNTSFNDSDGAQKMAKKLDASVDCILLDIATFPEGKAIKTFYENTGKPIILWSRPESKHNTHIGHNSFCGANYTSGNLHLNDRRFRNLFGNVSDKEFISKLSTAAGLIGSASSLRGSKIGLFGEGIVPKFYDIDINETDRKRLEKNWNIRFVNIPIDRLVAKIKEFESKVTHGQISKFSSRFSRIEVSGESLKKLVSLHSAVEYYVEKENLASTAIRCWPELQQMYSLWPCPVVSILNETGIPCACEGDPAGALDMLLAKKLSKNPSTLLDIVDMDDKADTLSIWHCGPTAPQWANKNGTRLIPHNVDGKGKNGKPAFGLPGVVDMEFKPGKVTVFRTLGALDDEFVLQGDIIPAKGKRICGSFGLLSKSSMYGRKINVHEIRDQVIHRGIPHHYTAIQGHAFNWRNS